MVKMNTHALQKYMALKHLNRTQLSGISGVPVTTITRIFKGYNCQDATAGKLAQALEADFDELILLWGDELQIVKQKMEEDYE